MSDLSQFVLGIYLGLFIIVAGIGFLVKNTKDKDQ